jgi:hypothetical protein
MNSVYRRRWRLMNGWFTTFASSCISKKVSDDIWQQAIDLWGEKGLSI